MISDQIQSLEHRVNRLTSTKHHMADAVFFYGKSYVTPVGVVGLSRYVAYVLACAAICLCASLVVIIPIAALSCLASFASCQFSTSEKLGSQQIFSAVIAPWIEGALIYVLLRLHVAVFGWSTIKSDARKLLIVALPTAAGMTAIHLLNGVLALAVFPGMYLLAWIQAFHIRRGGDLTGWIEQSMIHMAYNSVVLSLIFIFER
jgi:hypothetical protein